MITIIVAFCSLFIWVGLFFFHGRFWSRGPILYPYPKTVTESLAGNWPDVFVVVPARDEAQTIERVARSLMN